MRRSVDPAVLILSAVAAQVLRGPAEPVSLALKCSNRSCRKSRVFRSKQEAEAAGWQLHPEVRCNWCGREKKCQG